MPRIKRKILRQGTARKGRRKRHSPKLIDISPVISPQIAVFPGDQSFQQTVALSMKQGDHLMLSSITTTVHLGAHTDAPCHYRLEGADMASRALHYYWGTAQVIRVKRLQKGERIMPHHLKGKKLKAPRVLFCTNTYPDPNRWTNDFAALSPELVLLLHQQGVILVGIDTPSIDPAASKKLESHQAVAQCDMAILEGVILSHVAEGLYHLCALPLNFLNLDASPVRAVLVRLMR